MTASMIFLKCRLDLSCPDLKPLKASLSHEMKFKFLCMIHKLFSSWSSLLALLYFSFIFYTNVSFSFTSDSHCLLSVCVHFLGKYPFQMSASHFSLALVSFDIVSSTMSFTNIQMSSCIPKDRWSSPQGASPTGLKIILDFIVLPNPPGLLLWVLFTSIQRKIKILQVK